MHAQRFHRNKQNNHQALRKRVPRQHTQPSRQHAITPTSNHLQSFKQRHRLQVRQQPTNSSPQPPMSNSSRFTLLQPTTNSPQLLTTSQQSSSTSQRRPHSKPLHTHIILRRHHHRRSQSRGHHPNHSINRTRHLNTLQRLSTQRTPRLLSTLTRNLQPRGPNLLFQTSTNRKSFPNQSNRSQLQRKRTQANIRTNQQPSLRKQHRNQVPRRQRALHLPIQNLANQGVQPVHVYHTIPYPTRTSF